MTTTDRYASIADDVQVAATSTAVRDRREALGRAIEQLVAACARAGVDWAIVQTSVIGKTAHRIAITNNRTGERISIHGDLLEIIDQARDRLNREEWGR